MNTDFTTNSSIAALLKDLRDEATTLLRQQVALAKAEMKENVSRVTSHTVKIVTGGLVAFTGAIVLLIGLGQLAGIALVAAGLSETTARWVGPTLLGLIVAIIGWVMLSKAKTALTSAEVAPRETIETLREDKNWAQSKIRNPQ